MRFGRWNPHPTIAGVNFAFIAWRVPYRRRAPGLKSMILMPEADSRGPLERAAEARNQAIGQLAGHAGSAAEREELAGVIFRQYSYELLEDLLRVAPAEDNGDSWLRKRHDEQLLELGRELRDAFPQGEARHAVAQVIQRELLEAERRLKCALNKCALKLAAHPATVANSQESDYPTDL